MRTPKEVIVSLVTNMGSDPFGDSIEDLERAVIESENAIDRAIEIRDSRKKRLQNRLDRETEIAETLEYIKELK